jgi:small subunit ribosomal protein S2
MPRKKSEDLALKSKARDSKGISEKEEKSESDAAEKTEAVEETVKEIKEESKKEEAVDSKEEKLAKLKEKAKKLAGKMKPEETGLAKKVKSEEDESKYTLAPIEDYLKSSIHLGTRAITPDMKSYVYKRRADSLAVFNTALLDEKIREGGEYLAQYAPEQIVLVCKRDSGQKAIELFSKITGITAFTKNYPAGILTNPQLDKFMEKDLMFICDPWTDKAALDDAKRIKIPVIAVCDTNNYTMGVDKIVPGNNKSAKSLGFIFYLLAKIYSEKRKLKLEIPPLSEWVEDWDNLVPPK